MKRQWFSGELADHFSLRAEDQALLANKSGATRLGFAVLLKGYDWSGRTIEYHRAQICEALGFRPATKEDAGRLRTWLLEHAAGENPSVASLGEALLKRCRDQRIEPPSSGRQERIVRSALRRFQEQVCARITERLTPETCRRLDALLNPLETSSDAPIEAKDVSAAKDGERATYPIQDLGRDPGKASLESVTSQAGRLRRIRSMKLPPSLLEGIHPRVALRLARRASVEGVHQLHRHPTRIRHALLAVFCHLREEEIIDALADLLVQTVRGIGRRAERRVEKRWVADFKKVHGKRRLLFRLAEAALAAPDGSVRDVLFPVIGEETLHDLVREAKHTGNAFTEEVHVDMRSSYGRHYRRMLPPLLEVLDVQASSASSQPVAEAIRLLGRYAGSRKRYFPEEEEVPIAGGGAAGPGRPRRQGIEGRRRAHRPHLLRAVRAEDASGAAPNA